MMRFKVVTSTVQRRYTARLFTQHSYYRPFSEDLLSRLHVVSKYFGVRSENVNPCSLPSKPFGLVELQVFELQK